MTRKIIRLSLMLAVVVLSGFAALKFVYQDLDAVALACAFMVPVLGTALYLILEERPEQPAPAFAQRDQAAFDAQYKRR